jgi:hypothetical protein
MTVFLKNLCYSKSSQDFLLFSASFELCNDDERGNLTSANPKQAQVIYSSTLATDDLGVSS